MQRTCKSAGCGRRFRVPNQSRRLYCEGCRPPRRLESVPVEVSAPVQHVPGVVESSLRVVLERAGRLERYQAVLALRLARQLDSATSIAGAQGLASQVDALMTRALEGWDPDPPAADFVDDMAARRRSARGVG